MIIVHLNDDCGEPEQNCDVFVSEYNAGFYEGDGEALGLCENRVYEYNLSHCSCYGPLDDNGTCLGTYSEYKNNTNVLNSGRASSQLYNKFIEICDSL